MHNRNFASQYVRNELHQLFKCKDIRSHSIYYHIITLYARLNHNIRHIFDVNRLKAISSTAKIGKTGKRLSSQAILMITRHLFLEFNTILILCLFMAWLHAPETILWH